MAIYLTSNFSSSGPSHLSEGHLWECSKEGKRLILIPPIQIGFVVHTAGSKSFFDTILRYLLYGWSDCVSSKISRLFACLSQSINDFFLSANCTHWKRILQYFMAVPSTMLNRSILKVVCLVITRNPFHPHSKNKLSSKLLNNVHTVCCINMNAAYMIWLFV
jgi:hypothetical protein